MKKPCKILVVGLLAVSVCVGLLQAEERPRVGELRGTFVRLTEQRVGERGYLGVVVKQREGREHVTVLVSQRQEELIARARGLREGQRVEVAYGTEGGHKWIRELVAERARESRERPEEGRARRGTEALLARLERLERQVEELRKEVSRLRAELRESRGRRDEAARAVRREGQGERGRARQERPRTEREVAVHQLEVMKMALTALREANRGDAVELLTLAIRSREMTLEGRRDEEAQRLRERAPKREQLAEILVMSSKLWREFDKPDKAVLVGQLAEQLSGSRRRRGGESRERPGSERDIVIGEIEVMRMALPALKEANRGDAAELLTLAIRSREMMLEGRRDEEALRLRERAPNRGQLAEILSMAAKLWREFDNAEKATAIGRLAEQMAAAEKRRTTQRGSRRETEREAVLRQIKVMRYALHALAEADKKDAADLLERAIHARELMLEGRRDDEAMRIREGAPSRGNQIEILMLAEGILKELDQTERAAAVGRLAQELKGRGAREQR